MERPQLQHDLVRGRGRRAEPGAPPRPRTGSRPGRRGCATSRSRASASCARSTAGAGRNATAAGPARAMQGAAGTARRPPPARRRWRPRSPTSPSPDQPPTPCTSGGHSTAERPLPASTYRSGRRGVLHAAHPAVAGQRDQHQRRPEQSHPQPRLRGGRDRSAVAEHAAPPARRPAARRRAPAAPTASASQVACTPSADGVRPPAGAVQPGRARGGAVGQEVELRW